MTGSTRQPIEEVTLAAQRRQLTVMFCDLVGSTELSSRLDPEDMHEVIRAYHRCCTEHIEQAGGFVAKYLGDGVLAYFGYPHAHEDDPERAIQAALTLARVVAALQSPTGTPLAVRTGIATGLVVVGDLIGSGAAEERSVAGETPNLAARLQAVAPPGGVAVSDATRRLAAGLFDFRDFGPLALKGLSLREPAWEVLGPKAAADRFGARHERGPGPLVGREDDLQAVLACWARACAGESQAVGLVGEPGIGKSRLVYEIARVIGPDAQVRLEGAGAQVFRNSPFYAAAQMVLRRLARQGALSPQGYLAALGESLRATGVEAEHALPLIAELIGAAAPEGQGSLTLPAEQRRALLIAALTEWLLKTAAARPTLLIVEDLHWVDPSTLELLGELVARAPGTRLMLLYSTRDADAAPFAGGTAHVQLNLGRLPDGALERLVAAASGEALGAETVARIVARAGGVPLFAEELARLMCDRPDRAGGREIPATLSDLLMARLDELGPAKEVAQVASVLGAEFEPRLLAAMTGLSEAALAPALETLRQSDLVVPRPGDTGETYAFKHALILDAAYEALLKSQRRSLHRRAATILAETFPEIALARPEVLAQHWTEAAEPALAMAAWREAGRIATARRAYAEAEEAYRAGIALVEAAPVGAGRDDAELGLRTALAYVLQVTRGYSAPETVEASAAARRLADRGGDLQQRVLNATAMWGGASSAGDYETACRLADEALPLARAHGAPDALAGAYMMLMVSRYRIGNLHGAEEAYQDGQAWFLAPEYRRRVGGQSQSFGNAAVVAWLLGDWDEAERRLQRMLALALEGANPYELAFAEHMGAMQKVLLEDFEAGEALARSSIARSDEHGFPHFATNSRVVLGRALAARGQPAEGAAMIDAALASMVERLRAGGTMYLAWLAEAQALAGDATAAAQTAERALSANPQELFFRPECLRTRAAVRLTAGDPAGAAADLREAVTLARTMGAGRLHARAAADLADLESRLATPA